MHVRLHVLAPFFTRHASSRLLLALQSIADVVRFIAIFLGHRCLYLFSSIIIML
jgi:hypothetical protein